MFCEKDAISEALSALGRDNGGKGYSDQHLTLFTEIVNKVVEMKGIPSNEPTESTEVNIADSKEYKELESKLSSALKVVENHKSLVESNAKLKADYDNLEKENAGLKEASNKLTDEIENLRKELDSKKNLPEDSDGNGMTMVQVFPDVANGSYVKVVIGDKEYKGFYTKNTEFDSKVKTYDEEILVESKSVDKFIVID